LDCRFEISQLALEICNAPVQIFNLFGGMTHELTPNAEWRLVTFI